MAKLLLIVCVATLAVLGGNEAARGVKLPNINWMQQVRETECTADSEEPICELKTAVERFCKPGGMSAIRSQAFQACTRRLPANFESMLQKCAGQAYGDDDFSIMMSQEFCSDNMVSFNQCVADSDTMADQDWTIGREESAKLIETMFKCQVKAFGFEGEIPAELLH